MNETKLNQILLNQIVIMSMLAWICKKNGVDIVRDTYKLIDKTKALATNESE